MNLKKNVNERNIVLDLTTRFYSMTDGSWILDPEDHCNISPVYYYYDVNLEWRWRLKGFSIKLEY